MGVGRSGFRCDIGLSLKPRSLPCLSSSCVVLCELWVVSCSEAAIILLARDLNAAIKTEMGRIPGLTHKGT